MKKNQIISEIKIYTILMFVFTLIWYLLSGETSMLFFIFCTISSILALILMRMFDFVNLNIRISLIFIPRAIKYYFWISKEVFKAAIDVTERIWNYSGISRSGFCEIELDEMSDIGIVIFANSVTLTPGTISVKIEDNILLVHVIDMELEKTLKSDSKKVTNKINKLTNFNQKN